MMRLIVLAAIVMGSAASQAAGVPGALKMIEGGDTVADCRLLPDGRIVAGQEELLRLMADGLDARAKLLGLFDMGPGGELEAVIGWTDPPVDYQWKHEFQVFRGTRGGPAARTGSLALVGGPEAFVRFYRPPDQRDGPKTVIDVVGGATWAATYLLSQDGSSTQRLFEKNAYDFIDLNGDGVYELVGWERRPEDKRCSFGMFEVRVNPEVYLRSGSTYRKAWPPVHAPWVQIMALLDDVDGDGLPEIVSLTDTLAESAGAQQLAVYKLVNSSFHRLAHAPMPWPRIAYWLSVDLRTGRPKILVRTADRDRCQTGEDPEGSGTAGSVYVMRGGKLRLAAVRNGHR
jgi:hypothetical protein